MKRIILLSILLLSFFSLHAQNNRVGIGTTSPHESAILDITSTSDGLLIPRMTYLQRVDVDNPTAGLMVYQTNASGPNQSGFYIFDGSIWKRMARADEVGGGGNNSWTISADNQYSNLAGNVGVGTTTPASKFHLVGNMLQETGTFTINHSGGIVQFQNAAVNKAFLQLSGNNLRMGTNSGNSSASIIFRMNGSDRMALDSLGSLGLGTNSPSASAKMEITSTTKGVLLPRLTTSQMFAIDNPADGLLIYNTDYDLLAHYNGGWKNVLNSTFWSRPITSRDRITNAVDSVGIGNSGPVARLHVSNGSFANYSGHNGHLMLGSISGLNIAIGHYEILARDNNTAAPLYLQQDGGEVRIGSGGIAAGTKLQVTDGEEASLTSDGDVVIGEVTAKNLVMDIDEIQARSDGAADQLYLQQSGGLVKVGALNVFPPVGTKLQVTDGVESSLTSHGHFLIGNTFETNMVFDQNEIQARDNGGASTLFVQNDGGAMRVGSDNKLLVNANGNVGIGTSNPLTKLDVSGKIRVVNNNEAIAIDGNNPNIGFWWNGTFRSWIGQYNTELYIASNDKLHLDADQVAIGVVTSTADNYKLAVNGKIICEELKVEVSDNWPDYVFNESYSLKPLSELKSFINTHQHLPNIPSAVEVHEEGIEVGEMNRKLLEKIEELTLYVISLQEQIDELKSKGNE